MKTYIDIVCCLTWVFLKPMMSMLYFNINFTLSCPSFPLLLWKLLFLLSVAQNPQTKPLCCHNLFSQILWRLPLLSPKTFPFFLDTNFSLTSSLVWFTCNLCSHYNFQNINMNCCHHHYCPPLPSSKWPFPGTLFAIFFAYFFVISSLGDFVVATRVS